jgi:hypothetical protein
MQPTEKSAPPAVRRLLAELHLAMLRADVAPEDAQARVLTAWASISEAVAQGRPGAFESFYEYAWSLLDPQEEERWQRLETATPGMSEEEWRLREVVWCRQWLRNHPSAPGTDLVLSWEDICGQPADR